MPTKIELLKIRDFGELINDTFLFAKENLKPLLKYFFTFCGFFILASSIAGSIQQYKFINAYNDLQSGTQDMAFHTSIFETFGFAYALTLLFTIAAYNAIIVTTLSYITLYKEKGGIVPTSEEMWGYFKFFYLRSVGTSILLGILLGFGFLFCLIPGIYLYPIFSLVFPIMIIENSSFGFAFSRSFNLIKDNWWVTFGALIISTFIAGALAMLVLAPAGIFNVVSILTHIKQGPHLSLGGSILSVVIGQLCLFFYMIPIITIALCYFSLTEGKEGTGLLEKINRLGQKPEDNDIDSPAEEH